MDLLDIAIVKQLAGGGGGSGTDNYNDLSNLPKINDTTLSGNKSSSALGLQSEINSDSKLASDLVDDTNQDNKFVTSTEKNTWNGKQNAIDADHKLSSDLVDDANHTNKFVTSTEKNTWNGKQNAIDADHKLSSDLVDDANKTNKFVTSTEKNTWNNKQNAIDSDHKLSSSLVSFTTAEAAALASGIDSSKVEQIGTNQTNILYALNTGVKNLIVCNEKKAVAYGLTITRTQDGIQISGTATTSFSLAITGNALAEETQDPYDYSVFSKLPDSVILTGAPDSVEQNRIIVALYNDQTWVYSFSSLYDMPQDLSNYNYNRWYAYIPIVQNKTYSGTWKPMLRDASISDDTFVPGALPNYDLTRLEAEDRAALVEEIDSGAKNKFDISSATFDNFGNVFSITRSGSSATIKQVNPNTGLRLPGFVTNLEAGTYILSGCPSGGSDSTYRLDLRSISGSSVGDVIGGSNDYGSGSVPFTITTAGNYYIAVRFASGYTVPTAGITIKPMICTKAAFCLSQKFVPYRPDYQALVDKTTEQTFGIFKYNNNYSITAVTRKCNGFAWFTLSATSTANIAANTNTIIGFVDADVQPAGASTDRVIFTARVNTDPPSLLHSHIRGGDGYIYINSPTAIPAGTSISITGSYKY